MVLVFKCFGYFVTCKWSFKKKEDLYILYIINVIYNKNNNFNKVITMATLSVSIPDDLKSRMDVMEEVNWSAVARKAFEEKVQEVAFLKKIVHKSKMTQKDADDIAYAINAKVAKRFKEISA